MKQRIRVVVVDDQNISRGFFLMYVRASTRYVLAASLRTAQEAIEYADSHEAELLMKEHKTTWIQGIIPEDDAEAWYELNQPLLEIHIDADKAEAEGYDAIDQILVRGAECLIYSPPQFGSKVIEELWPCIGYLQDLVSDGLLTQAEYEAAAANAQEIPWLNLLTFCGFTNQPEDGSSLNEFDK